MSKAKLNPDRLLNAKQVEILELLYKFRFATSAKVGEYFTKSNPGMDVFRKLATLEKRNFITKRYFDNHKLLHKPVAYYLSPAGMRKLASYRDKDDGKVDIKSIYRDGTVGERFVMHCVTVFGLYNSLTARYGDSLEFLTKSDMAGSIDFPKKRPDVYILLESPHATAQYFVDILDDDAHLLIGASEKVKRYLKYHESGSWTNMGASFPIIIFVCNSEKACNKVQRYCEAIIDRVWTADIRLVITTVENLALTA